MTVQDYVPKFQSDPIIAREAMRFLKEPHYNRQNMSRNFKCDYLEIKFSKLLSKFTR